MAHLREVAGGCEDAGCKRPVKYALYDQDNKLVSKHCKTCAHRRLELLNKIEQRRRDLER